MSDNDIYAPPEADLSHTGSATRSGGNVDDAVAGNIEINMLETLGEAWRGMKGFKMKCHIALTLYFLVFLGVAILFGIFIGILAATGAVDPSDVDNIAGGSKGGGRRDSRSGK